MGNSHLGYNPVFESLSQQARKYSNIHIDEDVINYEGQKSQKYLKSILDTVSNAVISFSTSIPDKQLRTTVLGVIAEGLKSLGTGAPANIDAILSSLQQTFDKVYSTIAASTSKDKLIPIYDKVKEGIENTAKAYEELKKKYTSEMSNPVSLDNAVKNIKASIITFNSTLEELKKKA